jgi:alpha-N-arabinofuranosidase
MEDLVERHYAVTKGYGLEKKLGKLVVDEWGCWHPDGSGPSKGYNLFEQQSTMRDAVISALTLNIFNNHCDKVLMSNAAQVCNNLHCCLLVGGEHCITTPTYHVFDMYKEHQGATALRTLVSDNSDIHERVSASASEKDGRITLTLANLSCEKDAKIKLELLGSKGNLSKAYLLSSAVMKDHKTFEDPEKVTPKEVALDIRKTVTLPKASVMTIEITVV